jgi:DNA-binding response OmpR family regulator
MTAHRFTLVDDDPGMLFTLHQMVARLYPESSISMFSNPEDALAHILATGTDILITNHGHINGLQLIRELRLRKWATPIIAISAESTVEQEVMAAGATKFVDKRAPRRVLEAHIRALVEVSDTKALKQQNQHHLPLRSSTKKGTGQ